MSKVVIIGPAFPLRGGLATFNERMARALIKDGHEVVIYTFSLQYPGFLFPGKTQYSDSQAPKDLKIHVCINSINPLTWMSTANKIKHEKADFLIVRYWMPFMAPCLGSILRLIGKGRTTRIALVDNALPHEKRPGDNQLTSYFVNSADGFITMSRKVADDLTKFTAAPAKVISHPLYDNFGLKIDQRQARKQLRIPDDAYVYLFFGFIRHYKGLDILIQAFEKFDQEQHAEKKPILLIAGEFYADEEQIKKQILHSPASEKIHLHSQFIRDEEVTLYFSAANCVVQPYRSATQSGVTPLAYHFEVPMIVTDVGALADMVPRELGIVCQPDEASITEALRDIQKLDTGTFKTAIHTEKRKYSWDSFTDALVSTALKVKENG